MKILETQPFPMTPIPTEGMEQQGGRERLSLSSIASSVDNQMFHPDRDLPGFERKPEMFYWAEMGFIWEELLHTGQFRKRMQRRREAQVEDPAALELNIALKLDGVSGHPDCLNYNLDPPILEEYKWTTRGMGRWDMAKTRQKDFYYWFTQIKGYLKMADMRVCDLYVCWAIGEWKGGGPEPIRYRLQWTQEEINDNWAMLLTHAVEMGWLKRRKRGKKIEYHP